MNTGSLITLAMLNCGFGRGGVVEEGGEVGEVADGVSGSDSCGMCCLIKLTALLGETQAHSSSLAHGGEIKGLFPNSSIPSYSLLLCIFPLINVFTSLLFHITTS